MAKICMAVPALGQNKSPMEVFNPVLLMAKRNSGLICKKIWAHHNRMKYMLSTILKMLNFQSLKFCLISFHLFILFLMKGILRINPKKSHCHRTQTAKALDGLNDSKQHF